ncbi:hypothetical protein ONZ45_g14850 [Pleurotus djamor]|nr:hypothetical protein ONZ45_g14850 [Pleurotus djamor]
MVDTQEIRSMVNAAQRKGSSHEQRLVQPLPPAPYQYTRLPSVFHPAALSGQPTLNPPRNFTTPNSPGPSYGKGYSSSHPYHMAATSHWRGIANAPGDRCGILMELHHERRGNTRGKKLSERVDSLSKSVSEGKDISVDMSGAEIATLTRKVLFAKLTSLTPGGFIWDEAKMTVRDTKWMDLSLDTEEGHFRAACTKVGKDKKSKFSRPKDPFVIMLVIDMAHYEEYEDFLEDNQPMGVFEDVMKKSAPSTSPRKLRKGKGRRKAASTQRAISESDENVPPPPPLFTEVSQDDHPSFQQTTKRARSDSLAHPSTPPRPKRLHSYVSPDQQGLYHAMKKVGSITTSAVIEDNKVPIEFMAVIVPSFNDIIPSPSLTWSTNSIRHGTLCNTNEQVGLGSFKTCHIGTISLVDPGETEVDLLRGLDHQIVAVKRFYFQEPKNGPSRALQQIQRYGVVDEFKRTLLEANILRWASSLLEFGYSFVDYTIESLDAAVSRSDHSSDTIPNLAERLELLSTLRYTIPRLRFVHAAVVKSYTQVPHDSIASTATRADNAHSHVATYLIEERIPLATNSFIKYINNARATPLITNPRSPYYAQARFLCTMQHILYVKTERKLFVSDFQGAGLLLTDPQVMTSR